MAEVGKVINTKGPYLVVALERKEACAQCRACSMGHESKEMILEVENECNAIVGDKVTINLEKSNFLIAVVIMYTIPLISLLAGIGVGYLVAKNYIGGNVELISLVVGLVFLAGSYLGIRKNEHRFNTKKFRPIAEKVVKDEE
jgi:sigma-E factor negative regulatory protein RseC